MAEAILMRLKDPKTFQLDYSSWEYFIEAPNAIITAYINPIATAIEVPEYIKGFRTQIRATPGELASPFTGGTNFRSSIDPVSIDISKTNIYNNGATALFYNCHTPTTLPSLPNGITSMTYTYAYCSNLRTTPIIPNTTTNMYSTFYQCSNLTTMPTIPRNVGNMMGAFQQCSNLKTTTTIPNTVNNLYHTFGYCYNLQTAPIIEANMSGNMRETYYSCKRLTTVNIGSKVTDIYSICYGCTNLVNAPNIPNTVTNMANAFYNCTNLINMPYEIGANVSNIRSSFYNCRNIVRGPEVWRSNKITNFSYLANQFCNYSNGNANSFKNSLKYWNADMGNAFYNTGVAINCSYMFQDFTNLIQGPQDMRGLCQYNCYGMFYGCSNLVNGPLLIASPVNIDYMYYRCSNLTGMDFYIDPSYCSSMTSTFCYCNHLIQCPEELVMNPNGSVAKSMSETFKFCTNIINGKVYTNTTSLTSTFDHCYKLTSCSIPNTVTTMLSTFTYCNSLVNMPNIPNSVTTLYNCFSNCYNLKNVTAIPNSVTTIAHTFRDCYNLITTPTIPNRVINTAYTFYNCTNLTTVNGEINTPYLYYTFYYCNKLTGNLVFPYNAMTINNGFCPNSSSGYKKAIAYTGTTTWNSLNSYALPYNESYNLALIDKNAYDRTKNSFLSDYTYTNNGTAIILTGYTGTATNVYVPDKHNGIQVYLTNNTFKNNQIITSAFIDPGVKMNDEVGNIFYNCRNLLEVRSLPNTITNLAYAFYYCDKLVTCPRIPNSVTNMAYAFYECNALTEAYNIPNSVTNMVWAFGECNSLNCSIEIGTGVTDMKNAFRNCQSLRSIYINIRANGIANVGMSNAFNTYNSAYTKYIRVYGGTTTAISVNNTISRASTYNFSVANF